MKCREGLVVDLRRVSAPNEIRDLSTSSFARTVARFYTASARRRQSAWLKAVVAMTMASDASKLSLANGWTGPKAEVRRISATGWVLQMSIGGPVTAKANNDHPTRHWLSDRCTS